MRVEVLDFSDCGNGPWYVVGHGPLSTSTLLYLHYDGEMRETCDSDGYWDSKEDAIAAALKHGHTVVGYVCPKCNGTGKIKVLLLNFTKEYPCECQDKN